MGKTQKIGNATIMNIDCMEYMKTLPDKFFDLAVCDPPYGIKRDSGFSGFCGFGGFGKPIERKKYKGEWDSLTPEKEYFMNLLNISKNQIIWGGNFFTDKIPQGNHWLFWDKRNTMPSFGDGELAWTSVKKNSVKKIEIEYNGLIGKEKDRIHATQKPVKLYEWILTNYAKPGQTIFDSHMGSGSSAIACNNLGFEYVGCELDEDYYNAACERIAQHAQQQRLFE